MPRPNRGRVVQAERRLAQRIAYEREQRAWSLDGLAKRMTDAGCPINASAIYKIESGDPPRRVTVDELVALSGVFGLRLDELIEPMELLRQRRAREVYELVSAAWADTGIALGRLVNGYIEFRQLSKDDPDLGDLVYDLFPDAPDTITQFPYADEISATVEALVVEAATKFVDQERTNG